MFLQSLINRFPDKIYINYTFQYENGPALYLPDFIIYDKSTNIYIDIEIDEPYIGATGQPIHYEGSDNKRDQAFNAHNWVVIRFAESQVVSQPDECCNLILNVLSKLSFDLIRADSESELPLSVTQWTREVAHKMAFTRFRNTYLNRALYETLTLETLEKDIESENAGSRYLDDDDNDLPF
ncbi:hypothetical protein [Hymenobacter aerophilus]|uniref:hypothetical protein n=1 Tax=Hymenobacter aerophilus TaxID=119644 RepID=UPI00146B1B18|nr:hypothetical protein [Hymenobacter aerophilus]